MKKKRVHGVLPIGDGIEWTPRKIDLADLRPFEENPRVAMDKGLADLDVSIGKFGLAEPIAVQPDLTVIGGHQRLGILKKRGVRSAWCFVPSRPLTRDELVELNIRLNRNIAGEWDWDVVSANFTPEQLSDFGFDKMETDINLGIPSSVVGTTLSPRDDNSGVVMLELSFEREESRAVVNQMLKELSTKHKCESMGQALYLEVLEGIEKEEQAEDSKK